MIANGISWITFGWLYGALAAAVIALFLWRFRRRGRAVSSTLIWQKVMGVTQSFWQELFGLILQLVLFLLVCLALVDPRPAAEKIERRWVAFVFDASESMAAREGEASRLRLAERQAWQLISDLAPVDRVMLIAAGSAVEALTPFTANRDELKKTLGAMHAGGVRPRLNEAVAYAVSAFDYAKVGPRDVKHLVVLTDRAEQVTWPELTGFEKHVAVVGRPASNLAIVAFAVRPTMNLTASYDALVEVANFSDQPVRAEVAIFTPDQTLALEPLALPAGGRYTKVVALPFGMAGKVTALLRKTAFAGGAADALPSDDAAFAFVPPQRQARVLLVADSNVFLNNALALNPEIELRSIKPGEYSPALAAGVDVVFFDRVTPAPPPTNAVYFSAKGGPFAVKETKKAPTMTSWADGHPLLQHVTMDNLTIEEAAILQVQSQDVVLMGHYDGALMLLRPNGDRFLLGVGFDLAKTDLPLQAAFPILMHNIANVFAGRGEGEIRTSYRLGEKVELGVTSGRPQLTLQDPLENKLTLPVRGGLAVYRPLVPGFHAYADGEALRVFAASLTDSDESNLSVTPGEAVPSFPTTASAVHAEVYWPYFVLAAMLLAVFDMVMFFYGRLG
jgi:hypothetical protein